jgi:hypothetical protein
VRCCSEQTRAVLARGRASLAFLVIGGYTAVDNVLLAGRLFGEAILAKQRQSCRQRYAMRDLVQIV